MIVAIVIGFGLLAIAVAVIPILIGIHLHSIDAAPSQDSHAQRRFVLDEDHESLFDKNARKELEEWRRLRV